MIAAPGEAMNVHEQNPPTNLTIFLNKSKFVENENEEQFLLPEPLGDPSYEKLVKRRIELARKKLNLGNINQ